MSEIHAFGTKSNQPEDVNAATNEAIEVFLRQCFGKSPEMLKAVGRLAEEMTEPIVQAQASWMKGMSAGNQLAAIWGAIHVMNARSRMVLMMAGLRPPAEITLLLGSPQKPAEPKGGDDAPEKA